jgi:hydroxylaminobenzene mutase
MGESRNLLVAQRRDGHRLLQAGGLLFLLGLVVGLGVPRFTVPRLALSTHLLGITQGTFLMVGGLLWPKLRLTRPASGIGRVLAIYGCLAAWTANLFGAAWGAGASMVPMAAGGARGSAIQEGTIRLLLISAAVSLVCVAALILWGLRTVPHTDSGEQ